MDSRCPRKTPARKAPARSQTAAQTRTPPWTTICCPRKTHRRQAGRRLWNIARGGGWTAGPGVGWGAGAIPWGRSSLGPVGAVAAAGVLRSRASRPPSRGGRQPPRLMLVGHTHDFFGAFVFLAVFGPSRSSGGICRVSDPLRAARVRESSGVVCGSIMRARVLWRTCG